MKKEIQGKINITKLGGKGTTSKNIIIEFLDNTNKVITSATIKAEDFAMALVGCGGLPADIIQFHRKENSNESHITIDDHPYFSLPIK